MSDKTPYLPSTKRRASPSCTTLQRTRSSGIFQHQRNHLTKLDGPHISSQKRSTIPQRMGKKIIACWRLSDAGNWTPVSGNLSWEAEMLTITPHRMGYFGAKQNRYWISVTRKYKVNFLTLTNAVLGSFSLSCFLVFSNPHEEENTFACAFFIYLLPWISLSI